MDTGLTDEEKSWLDAQAAINRGCHYACCDSDIMPAVGQDSRGRRSGSYHPTRDERNRNLQSQYAAKEERLKRDYYRNVQQGIIETFNADDTTLEHLITDGGTSWVFLGRSEKSGKNVVVKVMKRFLEITNNTALNVLADHPDIMAHEAKALAGITSDHVVSVYSHGIVAGRPYMIVEAVETPPGFPNLDALLMHYRTFEPEPLPQAIMPSA
ncbi:MAG: hypothetical protein AABY13_00230, partial [Nanoarchaeota archaeon]